MTKAPPKEELHTSSGLQLPLFFDEDSLRERAFAPATDLGEPGEFPYTRGPQKSMYRGKLWTMRQYAGFSTALESNRRYRYLLERGTTGLSVAFDLPTQIGMDSDDRPEPLPALQGLSLRRPMRSWEVRCSEAARAFYAKMRTQVERRASRASG